MDTTKQLEWTDGSGRLSLTMTLEQAESVSHQGDCGDDVDGLRQVPEIRAQLDALNEGDVYDMLNEYGAWDSAELQDHDKNLTRVLWLAGCDLKEQNFEQDGE